MAAAIPSDADIKRRMEALVPKVDLETITTKQFITMLANDMGGVDLSSRKKYIKATLTEVLDAMDESGDEESESESESEKPPPAKKRRGGGGLSAVKEISKPLSQFLSNGEKTHMARTEVVKGLWNYIKEHDLQNPNDKREIILDDKMKTLFDCERFTMFTMNKYVGSHIHPFTPVNLESLSENSKKKKEEKAIRRQAKKDAARSGKKKKRKKGQHAPWKLSKELERIVGTDILPRPQVTSALWTYIKKNKLQNPEDGRKILCDEAMKCIMGNQDEVSMFAMNKYITPHMVEKLDKSAYTYPEESDKSETEDEDDNGEGEDVVEVNYESESGTEEEDSD